MSGLCLMAHYFINQVNLSLGDGRRGERGWYLRGWLGRGYPDGSAFLACESFSFVQQLGKPGT
jgi:hypothetical protein